MIDEPEDWHVRRKRFDAFAATELGGLYKAYENALTNYWKVGEDARRPYRSWISIKRPTTPRTPLSPS